MAVLSALKLAVVVIDTLIVAPIVVAVALVDENVAYRICQLWARLNLRLYGARVRTRRLAALDPARPYVIMSNHRSQFDILAVVVALEELQLRWVAKVELTRVPVFGWALKHTGHVIIDRSNTAQAIASLRAAREKMERGVSVVIFPEGTRSAPGQMLLPLKKGGFMMAIETGFPIVPIAIRGSREILPRGSWQPASGEIDVVVGAPIPVEGRSREELLDRVRAFMLEQLESRPPSAAAAS
ncbi:MAG TPA: lysophospholipid acyltransferase family protein [Candidatus Binatia bacterium]|nr:lysophospholipid acyltransferase family protein [Candidatus Binatia bacterium]